eukprot:scaffold192146_cov16-Tisochrysis_lutea.AAC.1
MNGDGGSIMVYLYLSFANVVGSDIYLCNCYCTLHCGFYTCNPFSLFLMLVKATEASGGCSVLALLQRYQTVAAHTSILSSDLSEEKQLLSLSYSQAFPGHLKCCWQVRDASRRAKLAKQAKAKNKASGAAVEE